MKNGIPPHFNIVLYLENFHIDDLGVNSHAFIITECSRLHLPLKHTIKIYAHLEPFYECFLWE